MPLLKSAVRLSLCCALFCTSACHHHHRHDYDASINPVGADDAGVCEDDASCGPPGLTIKADFNNCPSIGIIATPIQTDINQEVMVTSRAIDPDGDALSYEWTSDPNGSFDKEDMPVTYFHCESIGRKTIHLMVTDARGCIRDDQLELSCTNVPDFIGNGIQQVPSMP